MGRKPAFGLWRYARKFLLAAETLHKEMPEQCYPVDYYLVCHALELGFKAYLNSQSFTLEFLKNNMGHDLNHLLGESAKLGLQGHVLLSVGESKSIQVFSPIYKGKELEYMIFGPKTLPDWELLRSAADSLLTGIEAICRR